MPNKNQNKKRIPDISIENAQIGFRNFEGKAGKYNNEGNRNFTVFLEHSVAKILEDDGWNVRWLTPREEGEPQQPILSVRVSFENYPPKIFIIGENNTSTQATEETVKLLDWADIQSVDLTLRPYQWNVQGKTGVKAYLKRMYVVLAPDPFAGKYEVNPDSARSCTLDEYGNCID